MNHDHPPRHHQIVNYKKQDSTKGEGGTAPGVEYGEGVGEFGGFGSPTRAYAYNGDGRDIAGGWVSCWVVLVGGRGKKGWIRRVW